MIRAISIWLLVATFSDAGLFNAIGTRSTRKASSGGVAQAGSL